jgi:hypothetical protein
MFNGMIDLTEVRAQLGSPSQRSGGSSRNHRHHTEQEISQVIQELRLRAQEEYNAQMHDYFASYTQQQEMFQVSMRVR